MGRIVVVGGGFAGLNAAVAARRVGQDRADVVLISKERWLTIRPRLYEPAPEQLRVNLLETLDPVGVEFREADAVGIDPGRRLVLLKDGGAAPYERLVLATGSVMKRPAVPGSDLPFSIDDWSSAMSFDRRLREIAAASSPTIVVVGAGFTGIELALEMRDRIAAHGSVSIAEQARVVLVDRQATPGAELGSTLRPSIEKALQDARIELNLKADIIRLTSEAVYFADGSVLQASVVVLCTGLVANGPTAELPGSRDAQGRLAADHFLRIAGVPFVFGAGDVVRAEAAEGHSTFFSCQHSLRSGKFAGENAARDMLGLPLRRYSHERYVTCLDLGRSGAVFTDGWERTIRFTGEDAKRMKKRINTELIYPIKGTREEILAASELGSESLRK